MAAMTAGQVREPKSRRSSTTEPLSNASNESSASGSARSEVEACGGLCICSPAALIGQAAFLSRASAPAAAMRPHTRGIPWALLLPTRSTPWNRLLRCLPTRRRMRYARRNHAARPGVPSPSCPNASQQRGRPRSQSDPSDRAETKETVRAAAVRWRSHGQGMHMGGCHGRPAPGGSGLHHLPTDLARQQPELPGQRFAPRDRRKPSHRACESGKAAFAGITSHLSTPCGCQITRPRTTSGVGASPCKPAWLPSCRPVSCGWHCCMLPEA